MSGTKRDAPGMRQEEKDSAVATGTKGTDSGAGLSGEKQFPTEKLLKSKQLAGYQPDFARVILTEPAYSVSGAKEALDKALKGGRS